MLKRAVTFTGAIATALMLFVGVASSDTGPVLQQFTITITGHTGVVVASGAVLNEVGTVTKSGPHTYNLNFPSGPATITLEPAPISVPPQPPNCIGVQNGSFDFGFLPVTSPDTRYGGHGGYTQATLKLHGHPKKDCGDDKGPKDDKDGKGKDDKPTKGNLIIIDAGATEIFAVA